MAVGYISLAEALSITQKYIAERYAELLQNIDKSPEDTQNQIISYIELFLREKNIQVEEYSNDNESLAKRIYKEMTGYSFLDELFEDKEVEEINILTWKTIKIHYNNGKIETSKHHFFSKEHCLDIIRRLLSKSGMTINKNNPIETGYLQTHSNIRITVVGEGVCDEKIGCGVSIRIVNPKNMQKEDFIKGGLCNDEMLNFLSLAYSYGVSICVTGQTGTGKTTLMSYIMRQIPDDKRLITVEENTREYELYKYDENGYMINNVIHLVTRESEKEEENITLKDLIKTALTFDPTYLCVSEMKGDESVQAVAAANTGHAVITTTHTGTCRGAYYRMLYLSKLSLKNDISTEVLMDMICQAFPIVINIQQSKDHIRRISEITECLGYENGNVKVRTLYRYNIKENIEENGKTKVIGAFEKVNFPSDNLKRIFFLNGATSQTIEKYFGNQKEKGSIKYANT